MDDGKEGEMTSYHVPPTMEKEDVTVI